MDENIDNHAILPNHSQLAQDNGNSSGVNNQNTGYLASLHEIAVNDANSDMEHPEEEINEQSTEALPKTGFEALALKLGLVLTSFGSLFTFKKKK